MANILPEKTINLALQGGGSHGAFTWGVLDRLLEEEGRLHIEGISGTSAGAMNGAALLQGYNSVGGADHARKTLTKFWEGIGISASFEMPQNKLFTEMLGSWNIDTSPFTAMTDAWQRMFSPYQTNPLNINPLRDLVQNLFDMDAIRSCNRIKFFVSATNVETGRVRVFNREELTIDILMASACLPFSFHAVEIDGAPYWDGGYVGNPSIFPLIYNCESPDVVVVQINPLLRKGVPDTSSEIIDRLNEITFNASLISEMRAISFVQRLIEEDHLKNPDSSRLKNMYMHVVSAESQLSAFGAASKTNVSIDFLRKLKAIGRDAADGWLKNNWEQIGVSSSIDIKEMYL